jgi:hypothetical protein
MLNNEIRDWSLAVQRWATTPGIVILHRCVPGTKRYSRSLQGRHWSDDRTTRSRERELGDAEDEISATIDEGNVGMQDLNVRSVYKLCRIASICDIGEAETKRRDIEA